MKPRMSANMTAARRAHLRLREREVAQLRIGEDLVGELGRDVAAERGADQLALLHLLRQLLGCELPARGAHAQQRMDSHQELFAPDRMRQKVVDARLERRQALLRRFRDARAAAAARSRDSP